jgi:hypothetical protein
MNSFLLFLSDNDFDFDKIYIDKFYHSICNKKWILIDSYVLKWIGYESLNKEYKNKQKYIDLISSVFTKEKEFKLLNSNEFNNLDKSTLNIMFELDTTINGNKTQYLIISPDSFKESLLMIRTTKASAIRKYYLSLEKYFNKYVEYTSGVEIAKLREELKEAKRNQNKLKVYHIDEYKPLSAEAYIYVMTTKNYLSQNIFKIGHTKYLNSRVKQYKTGRFHNDSMELIFSMKVCNSESIEKFIFSKLYSFKHKDSEMFHINYYMLMEIMNEFKRFEEENNKAINNIFSKYKPEEIKSLDVSDSFDDIVREANETAGFGEKKHTPHIQQIRKINESKHLTTNVINERFKDVKLFLANEYTGRAEEVQKWRCLNILNHSFEATYEHAKREYLDNKRGCPYCGKQQILDKIRWYSYKDKTWELVSEYESWDNLKENNTNLSKDEIKIIKNIVREQRWLTPVSGIIYSIMPPDSKGKINLHKPLSEYEEFIIQTLGINYNMMKQRVFKTKFNFIIAIDENNKKVYVGESMTKLSNDLNYSDSDKKLNRKTIAKYIDSNKNYAGYIFRSCDKNIIEEYEENKYEICIF